MGDAKTECLMLYILVLIIFFTFSFSCSFKCLRSSFTSHICLLWEVFCCLFVCFGSLPTKGLLLQRFFYVQPYEKRLKIFHGFIVEFSYHVWWFLFNVAGEMYQSKQWWWKFSSSAKVIPLPPPPRWIEMTSLCMGGLIAIVIIYVSDRYTVACGLALNDALWIPFAFILFIL